MLFFLYKYDQLTINRKIFKSSRFVYSLIRKIIIPWILRKHNLKKYLIESDTKELFFLCSILKTQDQIDTLYKSGTIQQKAELIRALDSYHEIAKLTDIPYVLYPSVSLLYHDYEELKRITLPQLYEPEEVTLERSFSW